MIEDVVRRQSQEVISTEVKEVMGDVVRRQRDSRRDKLPVKEAIR